MALLHNLRLRGSRWSRSSLVEQAKTSRPNISAPMIAREDLLRPYCRRIASHLLLGPVIVERPFHRPQDGWQLSVERVAAFTASKISRLVSSHSIASMAT